MDNAGWHAQRRAQQKDDRFKGPDGSYSAEHIIPLDERFIGGLHPQKSPISPPPLPPKDRTYFNRDPSEGQTSSRLSEKSFNQLRQMSAVERSRTQRSARMKPHLQFMVGPLLRYDTVDEQGVWNGAALIVTADSGSFYEPHPILTYEWDPDGEINHLPRQNGRSFDLGPHPADPHSVPSPVTGSLPFSTDSKLVKGPNARKADVTGQEIWVHCGNGGSFTFWRFLIQIPLGSREMSIKYAINHGQLLEFFVPGRNQNMRWASYSCNGFSAGVNPDDFCGPGFQSGYDPVWVDLLSKHTQMPFHVLVGGGDQLYCDGLTREPELQDWVSQAKPEDKISYQLNDEILFAIDRYYFNHYCQTFRSGAFARANSSIPMANMIDDHDLIDGFGSYPDDLQLSPIFKTIGSRGYFFFLLFQCFICVEMDGVDDRPGRHPYKSLIIGTDGPYIPLPSHSFLSYLGPQVYILLLDCRAERRKDQVCSPTQYKTVFERLKQLPSQTEHLVVLVGIPIIYPRLVFLESALSSKFNPLVALSKKGSLGLSGFVNKFNAEAELLDDLNDHWTATGHKKERNWFIQRLQNIAKTKNIRISFLSGDVHCAAVGLVHTLTKGKNGSEIDPSVDHRYMINVVTSAIVNTPPPNAVINMVSTLATKNHRTLHHADTDETMLPIFQTDTDGSPRKQKFIMGRRNWCGVQRDGSSGDLIFDIWVEKEKGHGQTVKYTTKAPAPRWTPETW